MSFNYLKSFDGNQTFHAAFAVKVGDEYLRDPIAIRVVINEKERKIYWEDTAKGMDINYLKYNTLEGYISCKSEENKEYKFVYLTKEVFSEIKDRVVPIEKEFGSDQKLQKYYLETCFY